MKKRQQSTVNGQQSSSKTLAFSLLSLVIILLSPTGLFAQKDIELYIDVPEKWQSTLSI